MLPLENCMPHKNPTCKYNKSPNETGVSQVDNKFSLCDFPSHPPKRTFWTLFENLVLELHAIEISCGVGRILLD